MPAIMVTYTVQNMPLLNLLWGDQDHACHLS